MTFVVKAYAKTDDVLIAWCPELSNDWMGFQLERRNETTQQVTVLVNRIQTRSGSGRPTAFPSRNMRLRHSTRMRRKSPQMLVILSQFGQRKSRAAIP
jgi:hypothetical protein